MICSLRLPRLRRSWRITRAHLLRDRRRGVGDRLAIADRAAQLARDLVRALVERLRGRAETANGHHPDDASTAQPATAERDLDGALAQQ